MTLGFKRAGFDVVGAIEIDGHAVEAYRRNHGSTYVWNQDICQVSTGSILKTLGISKGQLDLLGGCPPCQGFSTLRTYNGQRRIRDPQNDLIFEFERLVLGLRPKQVMLENVPGLYGDRRLHDFRNCLEEVGYIVEAAILNVQDYGVPQRRRRLVLLASRVSGVKFATPARRLRTVREAIGDLKPAGQSGDELHDMPESRSPKVAARIRSVPVDGGSRKALPRHLRLECHKMSDGFKDVYGRMAWDQAAPTITTGCFNPSKGRYLHPEDDRAITMREAAILQSFPKSYRFPVHMGKVKIAMMIGNALPPEFIRRHAAALSRCRTDLKKTS